MTPLCFKRHRFPPQIIQHAVWLYVRFTLSFRDVEEMLAERGIDVSSETIRRWFLQFGGRIAINLRRARPRPNDRWHLDEMVVRVRRGRSPRLPRTAAPMRAIRKETATQAAEEVRLRTGPDRHRSAQVVSGCDPRSWSDLSSRPRPQGEQSRRERAPGGATTRAQDAVLQVGRLCTAFPLDPVRRAEHLPRPTPSSQPQ